MDEREPTETEGHERFEALALALVLGGLPADGAGQLRRHLPGCPACRARVDELRRMSAELAEAARDERRRRDGARRRTPEGTVSEDAALASPRAAVRHVVVAALVVALAALGFWNLHLRTAAATYFRAADERGQVLEVLAASRPVVTLEASRGPALVGTDGDRVAIVLSGTRGLAADERLVVWLDGADAPAGPIAPTVLAMGPVDTVDVATVLPRRGATALTVTVERGVIGTAPAGPTLVRVDLADG